MGRRGSGGAVEAAESEKKRRDGEVARQHEVTVTLGQVEAAWTSVDVASSKVETT